LKKRLFFYSLPVIFLLIVSVAGWFATDKLGNNARQEIIGESHASVLTLSTYVTSTFTITEGAVKSLSGSPLIAPALTSKRDQDIEHANSVLDRYNSASNASVSYLMDADGMTVASSNRNDPDSFMGKSYRFRPYFQEAAKGQAGRYIALGITSGKMGFYASYPVQNHLGEVIGVVTMKKDLDEMAAFFSQYPRCFLINKDGIIYLSSSPAMALKSLWPLDKAVQDTLIASQQFGNKPFGPGFFKNEIADGTEVTLEGKDYFVSRKVFDSDGCSIVLLTPTDRVGIYKLIGILASVFVGFLIVFFLIIIFVKDRSKEALRESESSMRAITDSAQDAILMMDPEGRISYWNPAAERILGYTSAEAIGKNLHALIVPSHYHEAHHAAFPVFQQKGQGAAVGKTLDLEALRKDGKEISVQLSLSAIHMKGAWHAVGVLRDSTERKRAEETLRKSEERFRTLADSTFEGIIIHGKSEILDVNQSFLQMIGYKSDEVIGKNMFDFIAPKSRELVVRHVQTGSDEAIEIEVVRKDGTPLTMEAAGKTIIHKDKPARVVALYNITERKVIELGLKNAHEKLEALATELERAARVKSEFLASMSHELRTPLNAVIGFSQVLQDQDFGPLNEKQKEYMLDILESGNHLLSLINDILDLSKVEAGKMELQISPVVVGDLLAGSLVMIKEKAMKHGITLETDIPEELSHFEMLADERKFKQILFNLLSNASKFTPDGGAITLSARRMAEGEGEVIQVSVKDTGIGIAPENQAKVFESFYQASGGLTSKTSGTGLGLPLARSFVKLHGGRMWVESEGEGKGSQFYFSLPVQPVLPEIGKHEILLDHLKRFISFSKRQDKTFALCFLYMKGENLQQKIHEIDKIIERNKRAYDFLMFKEEGIITLLLQDIDQDTAKMICERIVTDIKSKFETFETSFSLVSYPSDGDNPEELVEKVKAATRYQTSTHSEQVKGK